MRFLIGADVPPDPDSGAAGTVVASAHALGELGHDVETFWSDDLGRRIRHGNLHALLELPRTYRRAVAERLARTAYDAVILSQPHACLAGEWIRKQKAGPVFLNRSHGWEGQVAEVMGALEARMPPAGGLRRRARGVMRRNLARHEDRVVACADGMVVPCRSIATFLVDRHHYPADRIAVFPHGLPASYLEDPPTEQVRTRDLLYVGQVHVLKAPDLVAEVFNRVLQARPRATATWVCGEADHPRVREWIRNDVSDRITLLSWRTQAELRDLYDASRLFLFPSWYEGFGKAPFEAMARGCAVLATAVGGMADWIEEGRNGRLFEPGATGAMTEAALELIDDPHRASRLGRAGRATATWLTWERHARSLAAFVQHLREGQR